MPDYYGDEEGAQPRPGPDTAPAASKDASDRDESESQTALIPKALCPHEVGVGDTVTLKVVGVHESELEVEYADEDEGEKGESESNAPASAAPSRWDSMMG